MPPIRISDETKKRANSLFKSLVNPTNSAALMMAEEAPWDFKIRTLLDRLETALKNGEKRNKQ